MRLYHIIILILIISYVLPQDTFSQKKYTDADIITSEDLEAHVSFLASPLLKGRQNGMPGLEIAQEYIVSNLKLLGLKPVNGTSYFQPYPVVSKSIDHQKTDIIIKKSPNKYIFTLLSLDAAPEIMYIKLSSTEVLMLLKCIVSKMGRQIRKRRSTNEQEDYYTVHCGFGIFCHAIFVRQSATSSSRMPMGYLYRISA